MPGTGELTRLLERKEMLLRTSELNRLVLRAQSVKLRKIASWVDAGVSFAQQAKAVLGLAVPFLAVRRASPKAPAGLLTKLARGLAVAQSLSTLWRNWRGSNAPREADPQPRDDSFPTP